MAGNGATHRRDGLKLFTSLCVLSYDFCHAQISAIIWLALRVFQTGELNQCFSRAAVRED